jgi:hypothetical protein
MARDVSGVQPRAGVAWRPFAASSLIVRAGYGIYRNTNVYLPIALLLAQQPPWSRAFSLDVDPTNPVTLANGFVAAADPATTFDVDHRFKVGFTQNWQFSLQRDLPASLTVLTSYLGIKGSRLLQATIPTTFVHLTSHGRSLRHAAQVQLRRRLHNGLTWTTQYTLAKAMDDAASLSTLTLSSLSIAQDWEHPEAEWSRSSFDQRHQVTAQLQYTTGVGVAGGAFVAGIWGKLLRGWTVTSQLVSGSGSPFTPTYLRAVSGTGVVGPLRPDVIGPPTPARDGLYLNPAAYAAPSSSRGGSAGRYSVTGPAQFSLNAGVTRSFAIGERWNLDWRLDAINVLNQVTFAGVNAVFGNPQFGMANRANNMRKLHTTVRVRF